MPNLLIIIVFYSNFETFWEVVDRIQCIGPKDNILIVNNSEHIQSKDIAFELTELGFSSVKVIDNRKKFNILRFLDPSYDHWRGIRRAQRYLSESTVLYSRIMLIDPDLWIHKNDFFESIEQIFQSRLPTQAFIASTWSLTKQRKHYRTASAHFYYADINTFICANFKPSVIRRLLSIFMAYFAPNFFRPLAFDPGWKISLRNSNFFFIPATDRELISNLTTKFIKWSDGYLRDNKFLLNKQRIFSQAGIFLAKEKYHETILDFPPQLRAAKIDLLVSPDGEPWFLHGRLSQNETLNNTMLNSISNGLRSAT
jgi:hypothetical protein